MPAYSQRSADNLATCHRDLQEVFLTVIQYFDHSVTCGYRGEEEQNRLYDEGKSKLRYPLSNHNKLPSHAIDAYPWPIDFLDLERAAYFAGVVMGIARAKGIKLRCGIDWDQDTQTKDETFRDYGHFEIILESNNA
ncbi:MAG: M15 family peptidase [Candidatus Kariarchaeaceae archaeon]|jgi:peptidoglycan L-alanyl-D-glutamate endopeptidase CwlK